MRDRELVTNFLLDKNIDVVLSSPYKRAVDTVAAFAEQKGMEIETYEDFRERRSDSEWISNDEFLSFVEKQWEDFSYKRNDGECLAEVQERNIAALNDVLARYKDKRIVIGTHGTALSTIINYYDRTYGFKDFLKMIFLTPWVIRMDFEDKICKGMEQTDLIYLEQKPAGENYIVKAATLGELKVYRYVVVFSRYKDKWLYCRIKDSDAFGNAGGRIELGETPLEAAKRELYEETGALEYDIVPAFDYLVHRPNERSHGQVFLAHIRELSALPDYEIAEVKLFDTIPDKMRFPEILPVLFHRMQVWMNLNSGRGELWDVYDRDRNLTGRTHRRGDPLPEGDYHLVVFVWLLNSKGEYLITKRAPNKGYPNMWENTGGSAIAGDDSLRAVIREVKEETGLDIKPENGKLLSTVIVEDSIQDTWLFRQDFELGDVVLQENETVDAKYATAEEIQRMIGRDEFIQICCDIEDLKGFASEKILM